MATTSLQRRVRLGGRLRLGRGLRARSRLRVGPHALAKGMLEGLPYVAILLLLLLLLLETIREQVLAYVWGGRALRAVAPRSDSANFPGFFSILCSVFRDSVVTIFRVIS